MNPSRRSDRSYLRLPDLQTLQQQMAQFWPALPDAEKVERFSLKQRQLFDDFATAQTIEEAQRAADNFVTIIYQNRVPFSRQLEQWQKLNESADELSPLEKVTIIIMLVVHCRESYEDPTPPSSGY
jgi:adenylate kinase family enzyme